MKANACPACDLGYPGPCTCNEPGGARYIAPADIADSPDEAPPIEADPEASRPTIDRRTLLGIAAMLDAMRSQIDAALVVLDAVLDEGTEHPVEVASSGVTGDEDDECPHPRSRRQSLNTIGSGDDTPRWRCRDCGHIHDPPRRD